jgi:hypothetical protein
LGLLEGALRLTLLALLLQPVGDWRVRPAALALAALGSLLPGWWRSPWLWGALAALTGVRIVLDWPMADNHAYLLCWWCVAIAVSLSGAAGDPERVLALDARLLVGLVFAFATLWKLVLAPDFLDTRLMRITLITDMRLARVATSIAGLEPRELFALRDFVGRHVDGPPPAGEAPRQPARFRRIAAVATAWTVAVEAVVAIAFLSPVGWWISRWRDGCLLAFVLSTYPVVPVAGFGWLLLSQGFAQAAKPWARAAYVASFAGLIVARGLMAPW